MNKYRNRPVQQDNLHFASQAEVARYQELCLLLKSGLIRDLVIHPVYPLVVNGMQIGKYIADFSYSEAGTGRVIIEDVKSDFTRKNAVFRLKAKLMKALYGIPIEEILA